MIGCIGVVYNRTSASPPIVSLELGADEFASLAVGCFWFDTRVAFCSPSGREPRYLVSVVVGSDRCGVAVWQGGLEFDSESDLVCVHLCLSVWVGWVCRLRSPLRSRVTHSALRFETHPADKACFSQSFCMFSGAPTNATVGHVRVDVALRSITPCDDGTPPYRERGALVPNRSGLTPKPVPNLPKFESVESRDCIVVAVVPSGDQPITQNKQLRSIYKPLRLPKKASRRCESSQWSLTPVARCVLVAGLTLSLWTWLACE